MKPLCACACHQCCEETTVSFMYLSTYCEYGFTGAPVQRPVHCLLPHDHKCTTFHLQALILKHSRNRLYTHVSSVIQSGHRVKKQQAFGGFLCLETAGTRTHNVSGLCNNVKPR